MVLSVRSVSSRRCWPTTISPILWAAAAHRDRDAGFGCHFHGTEPFFGDGASDGVISTTAIAAHQIAFEVATALCMIPFCIEMAVTVRVGHALVRNDLSGIRRLQSDSEQPGGST
ncbi:hypothetical protein ACRQ5Q_10710 [Bradyrhizobium sp. PMVTL-01]|uniref:hypothetical protein n=1 Tax=Bradyrhizobium sp. PMVTL-01 TaxID=3434999 RepID=UPI003F7090E5